MNVFICDDDPECVELLSDWLRAEGYEVTTASSLDNALDQLQREGSRIGVAILDVQLGRHPIGGLLVAQAIPRGVPVFFLSGRARQEVIAEARGINAIDGASFWFQKPLDDGQLRSLHDVLLSLSRTRPTNAPEAP